MSEQTHAMTTAQGTFFSVLATPWPWPPSAPLIVQALSLQDGSLTVSFDTAGRLRAELTTPLGTREALSCPLLIPKSGGFATMVVTWASPDGLEILLGTQKGVGHIAASTIRPQDVPACITVFSPTGQAPHDFSKDNVAAIKRRHSKVAGAHPAPGKIAGGDDYVFNELRDVRQQMIDLDGLMANGGMHHLGGMYALLRKLIARGDPLPLLQLCAAARSLPLIMYTTNPRLLKLPDGPLAPSFGIVFNGSPAPDGLNTIPVDLDVWLDLKAVAIGKKTLTNRQQLALIGNTIGAHLDPNIDLSVAALRNLKVGIAEWADLGLVRYMQVMTAIAVSLVDGVLVAERA